ncbi:MAG: histidine kinase [Deltaproteobacteria bacterium]|nr:histidine kinase [Deltaproteobacteria bacterium]
MRQSQERFHAVFNSAPEALFIALADGRLADANHRAAQLTGYSREALKGMDLRELLTPWKPPPIARLQHQSPVKRPVFREGRLTKKNGAQKRIEFCRQWVKIDQENFWAVWVREVREDRQTEKILRDSQKKLRYLNYQIMTAQEEERRRISRELHDEVGQGLTALKLFLTSINRELSSDLQQNCQTMLDFLDEFIKNVRRLCRDLRPTLLEIMGLSESLSHLLKESSEMFHFAGTAEIDDIDSLCDSEIQINIYRIIQEALTNIGKYARATKVFLKVKIKPPWLQVKIEDNGIGFNLKEVAAQKAAPSGCMGLISMKERARMCGGALRIWSREGKGTKVSVTIPLTDKGRQLCLSTI